MCYVIFISRVAGNFAPRWLSSQMIKICDLSSIWRSSTVKSGYDDQLAESIVSYSKSSWCFHCTVLVFLLADQLHIHAERRTGEVIARNI